MWPVDQNWPTKGFNESGKNAQILNVGDGFYFNKKKYFRSLRSYFQENKGGEDRSY